MTYSVPGGENLKYKSTIRIILKKDNSLVIYNQKKHKEMQVEELKTSEEWYDVFYPNKELKILDPDGWDRSNHQFSYYEEYITKDEFFLRCGKSTVMDNSNSLKENLDRIHQNINNIGTVHKTNIENNSGPINL